VTLETVSFYAKSLFENSGQEFPNCDKLGHAFGEYLGPRRRAALKQVAATC
jgi:hypothetical protein